MPPWLAAGAGRGPSPRKHGRAARLASRRSPVSRLLLEGTDVHDPGALAAAVARPRDAALVGGGGALVGAAGDGCAAREQGVRLRRPTVVRQRGEQRVERAVEEPELIALRGTEAAAVDHADQAVTFAREIAEQVPRDDEVGDKVQGN